VAAREYDADAVGWLCGLGILVNALAPGPVWMPLQVSDGQSTEKFNGWANEP